MLLRSFKTEGKLELWATGRTKDPLVLIKTYDVCAASGELGPKREMGDLQVPEGFYSIDALNAWSTFHLSLHVDNPNAADVARGAKTGVKHLGGQIMVHGNCVTIGCIPIEDEFIKEVYLVMKDARIRGARTPIHLFPRRLDDAGLTALLASDAPDDVKHLWRELAEGYRAFEATHRIPRVRAHVRRIARGGAVNCLLWPYGCGSVCRWQTHCRMCVRSAWQTRRFHAFCSTLN